MKFLMHLCFAFAPSTAMAAPVDAVANFLQRACLSPDYTFSADQLPPPVTGLVEWEGGAWAGGADISRHWGVEYSGGEIFLLDMAYGADSHILSCSLLAPMGGDGDADMRAVLAQLRALILDDRRADGRSQIKAHLFRNGIQWTIVGVHYRDAPDVQFMVFRIVL